MSREIKITKSITNRNPVVEKYLQEISKIPMIEKDEEVRLAGTIRSSTDVKQKKARDKLAKANLRFVVSVAKQYQGQGLDLGDLVNEGNIGLIKAAERFDETRGFKFISYAVWWIRQSILQALAETGKIVRLPLNKVGANTEINRVHSSFMQKHEREPSIEEIAELTGFEEDDIQKTISATERSISLDAPIHEDADVTFGDGLSNQGEKDVLEPLMRESLKEELGRLLRKFLNERQYEVITRYYGIGWEYGQSLEEIRRVIGLGYERTRQVKEKAERILELRCKESLKKYLG